jgi:5S rRNA maturation endonuclease (ribonuclease M5)
MNLNTVADYYHKRLFENENALEYLKSRGFTDTRLLTRFQIGFADGSIFEKLSATQKESLKQQGIITDKGLEHFKDCVTVPIFDDLDRTVGMYGRSINQKSKVPHLYLKGKHRSIFNRKASKVYDEIILTESILDALSLIQLGIDNVQAIYGTGGFTDEHLNILKDDRVKTIVIAFDSDEAGETAAEKLKERLPGEGFRVKVVTPSGLTSLDHLPLTKGEEGRGSHSRGEKEVENLKDWNERLVSGGDSASLSYLKQTIEEAIDTAEVFKTEQESARFRAEKDHPGYLFTINDIAYRVTGAREIFISNLRVNIKAEDTETGLKYYDNLDLYSARSRSAYSVNIGRTLDIEPNRIEKDLIAILEYLEKERDRHLLRGPGIEKETELTPEERELGLSFLKSPEMFAEIIQDIDALGYVGEDLNKQLMYIAATSRKLDDPISVMMVSESASGKSLLIDTVARLIPPDEVISVTSLSEQALNYMEDLSRKFVSLGEIVHSEVVEHQIREMLSKKELSRLVTTKEPQTGKLVTKMVKIPAVVALAVSGTRYDMNPENTSRCFMVNADESREQTRRIHEQQWTKKYSVQRKNEKEGLIPEIVRKHHAAQKLLQPVTIENPFGQYLDFPNTLTRTRRDNDRFVDLIACVCFLRQFQKEKKYDSNNEPYIEFDLTDYEIAYRIMVSGVLSSSLLEISRGALNLYEYFRELARKRAKKENIEAREVGLTQRDSGIHGI